MAESNFQPKIEQPPVRPEGGLERAWERAFEQASTTEEQINDNLTPAFQATPAVGNQAPVSVYKDPRLVEIENILEADLEEIYFNLPDESKIIFKTEGEETARKINSLLDETKVAVQKILDLIVTWLSVVPGVNRFFVEQEAKIKTDKIIAMK